MRRTTQTSHAIRRARAFTLQHASDTEHGMFGVYDIGQLRFTGAHSAWERGFLPAPTTRDQLRDSLALADGDERDRGNSRRGTPRWLGAHIEDELHALLLRKELHGACALQRELPVCCICFRCIQCADDVRDAAGVRREQRSEFTQRHPCRKSQFRGLGVEGRHRPVPPGPPTPRPETGVTPAAIVIV